MRSLGGSLGIAAFMVAGLAPLSAHGQASPKGPLNTLADVQRALRQCWQWPPLSEVRSGMELTVRLSFKRNGEIFGARITYQTRDVSAEERALYHGALLQALSRCSPLPVSESLGAAIAGRPLNFHLRDTRTQRKAEASWPVPKTR